MGIAAVVILLVVAVIYATVTFNSLIKLRNRVDNAWAHVDVQLKRRYDLIPNLVETVKGYAAHEQDTLEGVVDARNRAQAAATVAEQGAAENVLTGALRRLFALAEAYPELRASDQFGGLREELSETENKVAIARQIHNDTVLTYNTKTQTIPSNVIASMAGFRARSFFDFGDEVDAAPDVSF